MFFSKMVVDSVSLNSWLHMWARMCKVHFSFVMASVSS